MHFMRTFFHLFWWYISGVCANHQVKDSNVHFSILLNSGVMQWRRQFSVGLMYIGVVIALARSLPNDCIICRSVLLADFASVHCSRHKFTIEVSLLNSAPLSPLRNKNLFVSGLSLRTCWRPSHCGTALVNLNALFTWISGLNTLPEGTYEAGVLGLDSGTEGQVLLCKLPECQLQVISIYFLLPPSAFFLSTSLCPLPFFPHKVASSFVAHCRP